MWRQSDENPGHNIFESEESERNVLIFGRNFCNFGVFLAQDKLNMLNENHITRNMIVGLSS